VGGEVDTDDKERQPEHPPLPRVERSMPMQSTSSTEEGDPPG
jgi:hypothetical protein